MKRQIIRSITHDIHETLRYRGISKTEFARKLKVHPSYVTKLLKGKQNFSISTLCKIATVLHADITLELNS